MQKGNSRSMISAQGGSYKKSRRKMELVPEKFRADTHACFGNSLFRYIGELSRGKFLPNSSDIIACYPIVTAKN